MCQTLWAAPAVRLGLSGRNSGKNPERPRKRSELEYPSRVRQGCPKTYNSGHLKAPEHFQNSLPPSTAGDASLFSGSGEGLSEPVMQFPAALRVFLTLGPRALETSGEDYFRKILVSVKYFARNSGAGNGCTDFMGAWKKLPSFCSKTSMPIKFLVFGVGGILGFGGGGGSADFIFMGARIFLTILKRT